MLLLVYPIFCKLLLCVSVLPFDKGGTLLAKYPWTIRLWIGASARTRPGPSFWVAVRCCRNRSATGDPDVNLIVLCRGNANTHSCSILESVAFQFFKVLLVSCSLGWSQHHICISSCFRKDIIQTHNEQIQWFPSWWSILFLIEIQYQCIIFRCCCFWIVSSNFHLPILQYTWRAQWALSKTLVGCFI